MAPRIKQRPAHLTAMQPGADKKSNPHKARPAHRGFVPRGLSDAKRHPKLFTTSEVERMLSELGFIDIETIPGSPAVSITLGRKPAAP